MSAEAHWLFAAPAEGRGQRLRVTLPWIDDTGSKGVSRPFMPGWVARCIERAMERGWNPRRPGPEYRTSLDDLLPGEPWPLTSRERKAQMRKG